ncbi:protein-L-isoaspartate O-methyltransferase [Streptomyces albospinus]|uniref:Protein-L-isoaspartate O-methyltransferase n=1 Tax=Streptomyces albospinus TaxID=285515 RepID=A0ABQ2VM03_9ACTN|nr:methyltransferase domain-containing protein [Streptomyces albospinus]GGU96204.1 protein-L-isoaspartate O-methyltransferase [Streptomyces albospinus]
MANPLQGHAALVHQLDERGLLSPPWRAVWERTAREPYLPDRVWRQDPDRCRPVTGTVERSALVYADEPVVTQVDDGAEDGPGIATSSNSQPSMVARMLHLLDVHDGQRVLEIGTATGYVAALLSARLGDQWVTSVEIDPFLSAQAERNLAAAGYRPRLVVTDGEHGWPTGAPYDRIIATCALRHIPHELIDQLRPGGVLVAPRVGDFWCGSIVRLVAAEDGSASGPFTGTATYMPMRSHRAPHGARPDTSNPRSRTTAIPPQEAIAPGLALYAGARLPGITLIEGRQDAGLRVWVHDGRGSGAIADADSTVTEFGPRSLWDEVEATWQEWNALKRPPAEDFGLTVTTHSEYLWLRTPSTPVSPLRALESA